MVWLRSVATIRTWGWTIMVGSTRNDIDQAVDCKTHWARNSSSNHKDVEVDQIILLFSLPCHLVSHLCASLHNKTPQTIAPSMSIQINIHNSITILYYNQKLINKTPSRKPNSVWDSIYLVLNNQESSTDPNKRIKLASAKVYHWRTPHVRSDNVCHQRGNNHRFSPFPCIKQDSIVSVARSFTHSPWGSLSVR